MVLVTYVVFLCMIAVSGVTDHTCTSSVSSVPVDVSWDAMLAKLVEMGFQIEEGREALQQSNGDVEAACELLGRTSPASGLFSSFIRCIICIVLTYDVSW